VRGDGRPGRVANSGADMRPPASPRTATARSSGRVAPASTPSPRPHGVSGANAARGGSSPDEQQDERRRQRRAYLGNLDPGERHAWFDWLNTRDELSAAAAPARRDTHIPTRPRPARGRTARDRAPRGMRDCGWLDKSADHRQLLALEFASHRPPRRSRRLMQPASTRGLSNCPNAS